MNYPNWTGKSRTNYVRVKDDKKLAYWLDVFGLSSYTKGERTVIYCDGLWPDSEVRVTLSLQHELDVRYELFDPAKHIMPYLYDDQILVTMSVGFDGLHELRGEALAYHPDGRMLFIGLDQIYNQVEQHFNPDQFQFTYARR